MDKLISHTEQLILHSSFVNELLGKINVAALDNTHLAVESHDYYNYYGGETNVYYLNLDSEASKEMQEFFLTVVSTILVVSVVLFVYIFLMLMGFWLFAPMVTCLIYTGGELSTCSFNFFDANGQNPF